MKNIACFIRDENVARSVESILRNSRLACESFTSEMSLLRTMRRRRFDLILIDAGYAEDVEERIFSWLNCRTGESTPVVMMSSSCSASRVALALDAGADDVIANPVEPIELVARLQAIMRRGQRNPVSKAIELGGYSLDQESCTVRDRGELLDLTPREFMVAWLLFSAPGNYLSRETIGIAIWGTDCGIANRTIEQHIYKLRKKLRLSEERGVTIRTGYSQGYRLELCGETAIAA